MKDTLRPVAAGRLLPQAIEAGRRAGVSRLADVTRLDAVGLPVWQAIRPLSRALSVHQGRGSTHDEAKLGALMEAVESDCAERFAAVHCHASWQDLPIDLRPDRWDDFARDRLAAPSAAMPFDWTLSRTLDGRGALVPFDCVSMDLTRQLGTGLERSSNGLAAGFSSRAARMGALLELVERDALADWRECDMAERMERTLDLFGTDFDWLQHWVDRLAAVGGDLQAYHVPSITGTPVFAVEISDHGKRAHAYRAMEGTGAHPSVEVALWRAVSEAIQCRAIYVAGSRDDILPQDYDPPRKGVQVVFGLPPPPGMDRLDLRTIDDGDDRLDAMCEAIEAAGLGPALFVDVDEIEGIHVVKAFAPGLGHRGRSRWRP